MSCGNGGKVIFQHDVDRHDFIKTLAETCQKTGFEVHAYCLRSNHFHVVRETPNANLVAGMKWLLATGDNPDATAGGGPARAGELEERRRQVASVEASQPE